MAIRLSKLLLFLFISFSCKQQQTSKKEGIIENSELETDKTELVNKEKNITFHNKDTIIKHPDFLDKKYFTSYQIQENCICPAIEYYKHMDTITGYFSIFFIGKNKKTIDFWKTYMDTLKVEDQSDYYRDKNNYRKSAIESNINDYNIITIYVPGKYLTFVDWNYEDFDYKMPYREYFYKYEDNRWKLIDVVLVDTKHESPILTTDYLNEKYLKK